MSRSSCQGVALVRPTPTLRPRREEGNARVPDYSAAGPGRRRRTLSGWCGEIVVPGVGERILASVIGRTGAAASTDWVTLPAVGWASRSARAATCYAQGLGPSRSGQRGRLAAPRDTRNGRGIRTFSACTSANAYGTRNSLRSISALPSRPPRASLRKCSTHSGVLGCLAGDCTLSRLVVGPAVRRLAGWWVSEPLPALLSQSARQSEPRSPQTAHGRRRGCSCTPLCRLAACEPTAPPARVARAFVPYPGHGDIARPRRLLRPGSRTAGTRRSAVRSCGSTDLASSPPVPHVLLLADASTSLAADHHFRIQDQGQPPRLHAAPAPLPRARSRNSGDPLEAGPLPPTSRPNTTTHLIQLSDSNTRAVYPRGAFPARPSQLSYLFNVRVIGVVAEQRTLSAVYHRPRTVTEHDPAEGIIAGQ